MLPFMAPMMMQGAVGAAALRPQDVFATSLYTGTRANQQIINGLNLAGSGGLVWGKRRVASYDHALIDSARGLTKCLHSSTTAAEATTSDSMVSFNSNGFTLGVDGSDGGLNFFTESHVAWSFRRAAKFFDIVTYAGNGLSGRNIAHALGVAPGMIIVKRRDAATNWPVQHLSLPQGANAYLYLNTTASYASDAQITGPNPTATTFSPGFGPEANASGGSYVAYLFAHDPDTTNGIVQCGGFTLDGGGLGTVNLGWRPQFLLFKTASVAQDWFMFDTARGWDSSNANILNPDLNVAEASPGAGTFLIPTATGFQFVNGNYFGGNRSFVYLAIRAPT